MSKKPGAVQADLGPAQEALQELWDLEDAETWSLQGELLPAPLRPIHDRHASAAEQPHQVEVAEAEWKVRLRCRGRHGCAGCGG